MDEMIFENKNKIYYLLGKNAYDVTLGEFIGHAGKKHPRTLSVLIVPRCLAAHATELYLSLVHFI